MNGSTAGAYRYLDFSYPTAGTQATLTLNYSPADPSTANAVGVNLWQNGALLATTNGVSSTPGSATLAFSSSTAGPILAQLYNYTNGESVDFSYIVRDGDRLSVYPVFESLDIDDVNRLRPSPLRDTRFVLDVHLRKLARRMRLMGFDVNYEADRDDQELAYIAERENRILLSRDRQLLMRRNVSRGIIIRNDDPHRQIVEVLERLDLWDRVEPFSRCIECNGSIEDLPYNSDDFIRIRDRIPEGVLEWCSEYLQCSGCKKIYWKGSHFNKLVGIVNRIMEERR